MSSIFESAHLDVRQVGDDAWMLLAPLVFVDEQIRYVVPAGIVSDFASVPRPIWWLFPKSGRHNRAAVLHDWLCEQRPLDSPDVHAVFRRALGACGVLWPARLLMWSMVRVFGPRFSAVEPD